MCSIAPADALTAVWLTTAARRFGIITPLTPLASADLIIAPRLCGSSIWSNSNNVVFLLISILFKTSSNSK